ncbi:MAG: hypothetical protein ACTHM0_01110 [Sphingomonas sp.]
MLGIVVAVLAIGGRPDPTGPAIALDGAWRFHPGDNLQWADPQIDDRSWDRLDLVSLPSNRDDDVGLPGWLAGWRAHGHPDLEEYGWYRRRVALPAQGDLVLLGPTMVDDGYEMFWNGRPIGGIGKLGADPKVIGARPFLVALPRDADQRSGVLAIRTFMQPGLGRNEISGGLRSVPTLATAAFGERLYRAQWMRTIAGYIVEIVIPIMMVLLAGIALAAASSTARPNFARWLAIALVATACLRLGNAISAWTDLLGASTLDRQNAVILSPLAMLAWTAAWNEWTEGRDRSVVLGCAVAAWAARVIGAIARLTAMIAVARIVFIILFAVIAIRVAVRGERKPLALATMLLIAIALFVNELSQLGIPTIWFPFNIGVTLTQYVLALSIFLLAFALPGTAEIEKRPSDKCERPAGQGISRHGIT